MTEHDHFAWYLHSRYGLTPADVEPDAVRPALCHPDRTWRVIAAARDSAAVRGGLLPDGWHVRDGALHDADGNVVETPDEENVVASDGDGGRS